MNKKNSKILDNVHKTLSGLHQCGAVDTITMREFDALCLPKVPKFEPKKIKKLRNREKMSQPVFASFLNVSPSTLKKWESGEKHPQGAAARLLDIIQHHGLDIIQHGRGDHKHL